MHHRLHTPQDAGAPPHGRGASASARAPGNPPAYRASVPHASPPERLGAPCSPGRPLRPAQTPPTDLRVLSPVPRQHPPSTPAGSPTAADSPAAVNYLPNSGSADPALPSNHPTPAATPHAPPPPAGFAATPHPSGVSLDQSGAARGLRLFCDSPHYRRKVRHCGARLQGGLNGYCTRVNRVRDQWRCIKR